MSDTEFLELLNCEGGMAIYKNEHKASYVTVEDYLTNRYGTGIGYEDDEWVSMEEKEKAIKTNTLWVIHVYPQTPIPSYVVAASSLDALIRFLKEGNVREIYHE